MLPTPFSALHYWKQSTNIFIVLFWFFFWFWTPLTPFPLTVHACLFVLFPLCCEALCCNKRTPFVWDAGFEQLQAARHRTAEMRGDIQQSTNNEGTPLRLKISLASCFLLSGFVSCSAEQRGVPPLRPSTSFTQKKPTMTILTTSSYHYHVYRAFVNMGTMENMESAQSKQLKELKHQCNT